MKPDHSFDRQLANLDHESTVIANYVYAEMAIHHAASQSKRLLNRLNRTPTFWITCNAALQSAAYIAIGRVFDPGFDYSDLELMRDHPESAVALKRKHPKYGIFLQS